MKKILVLSVILLTLLTSCGLTSGETTTIEVDEKAIYQQTCWDLGGSITKDGCVLPEQECPACEEKTECPDCICNFETPDSEPSDKQSVTPQTEEVDEYAYCKKELEAKGAPEEMVEAICVPFGKGDVSDRVKSGEKVAIGTFTFDFENRVWVDRNFTVPPRATYAFEYLGAESKLLKAGFWLNTELGWDYDSDGNVIRVPFTICWDYEGACALPQEVMEELFPTN
jgi:hypothetical protein